VSEAENKAKTLITNAETREREITTSLENTKSRLEERIEELRGFEASYRTQLRSYIEGQLEEFTASSNELDGGEAKN